MEKTRTLYFVQHLGYDYSPFLDSAGVVKDFATSSCWLLALSLNYCPTAGCKQRVILQTAANILI